MIFYINELEHTTSINQQVELNDLLTDSLDLIKINTCLVTGQIKNQGNTVIFDIVVTTNITQACALTLKPVTYDLKFDAEIIFSNDLKNYDYILENKIDLRPIILAYIITEKEPTVIHPSADKNAFDKVSQTHPAFAQLKDLDSEK